MNIVVLDGKTCSDSDQGWSALKEAADNLTIYPHTAPDQVVARLQQADAVLLNKVVIDAGVLAHLPRLRYIGILATGCDNVDLAAARDYGVTVTNVPDYSTESVTQAVFAYLLHFTQAVSAHNKSVHNGDWVRSPNHCYWVQPLYELAGRTLGIIGMGNIGKRVSEVAQAFGMQVVYHSRTRKNLPGVTYLPDLASLCRYSDFVTLHCPATSETRHMVNQDFLAAMASEAYLINTARGTLVDESALADALNNGHIAGAGLDVLAQEPPVADNPLLSARNCVLTPHVAWATLEARKRLITEVGYNLAAFREGRQRNVVNQEAP